MNIEIVSNNDENFNIQVKKFGEVFIASDGEHVSIGVTENDARQGVEDILEINSEVPHVQPRAKKPVPMTGTGSSLFGGTMWGK